jgi:adenylate cyclase
MARLLVVTPQGDKEYELGAFTTLGRQPDQHVQILDRVVSKQHALITKADDQFWLIDQNSRNGTFVNGTPINGRTPLTNRDEIIMGSTRIIFDEPATTQMRAVSIQPPSTSGIETSIRAVLQASEPAGVGFLPEDQITDPEALRTDYEKLRIAFELNRALGAELEFDRMFEKILEEALSFTGADRGAILLLREDGELEQRCSKREKPSDEPLALSRTIIREVIEKRNVVLSNDAKFDDRFKQAESVIMTGMRSTMCVPLLYDGAILGMIHLDTRRIGHFKQKDLQILNVFGQQAAVRIAHARVAKRAEEEAVARAQLQRMISPNVAEQIVSGKVKVSKGGTLHSATVLFIDIRGFTTMSERIPPKDLVSMLNEYFEIMVEIVFKYEGTLDKFIGDEIMAVWGAPLAQSDHTERAVQAALDMQRELTRFNRFRMANGQPAIEAGCGINCGEMVAGYMGSSHTLSYTVIGDAVNTAARLCSEARPGQIVVSDTVTAALENDYDIEALPPTRLKGKSNPVDLFLVKGRA